MVSEHGRKLETIRAWMVEHNLGALYLQTVGSFAWATCGASSSIIRSSTNGLACLLITQERKYLITSNIEAPRLENEEKLAAQGWEFVVTPWFESHLPVTQLSRGLQLGSDGHFPGAVDLAAEIARARARLTPEEGTRFRELGKCCAQVMHAAALAVRPGETEHTIGARLVAEAEGLGVQVIANLIATDERIRLYRHPLPTGKKLERYAMLVLCGRHDGLVCSLTRLVHFGPLPDELKRKAVACTQVDATFIKSTRPGERLGDIFEKAISSYAESGYPGEWKLHHQGGAAGYEPREYLAVPGSPDVVSAGQVYAWNPSITGVKSEDTIMVRETGNEILTEIPGWPVTVVDGIPRPSILVV